MFDPHRTRRSDRRYYTRKGQVIQASRVNVNPTIDQRLVPIYKNYIIKNNLLTSPPPPAPPQKNFIPAGIVIKSQPQETLMYFPFTEFTFSTEETININMTTPSEVYHALLIFQQKKDGSFEFITFSYTGTIEYTIKNNAKCYYKSIGANGPGNYNGSWKGIYHTSPSLENVFISFDPNEYTPSALTTQFVTLDSEFNIEL